MSHEHEPKFHFRKDHEQEEEDRMNDEEDDEELRRQEKQDYKEDEDVYSDDMRAVLVRPPFADPVGHTDSRYGSGDLNDRLASGLAGRLETT